MSADDSLRGDFFGVLMQLAVKSSIIPKCLEVDGIQEIAVFPITSGGFGEVADAIVYLHSQTPAVIHQDVRCVCQIFIIYLARRKPF